MNEMSFRVRLKGIRPMMFDRYAGDNTTTLPNQEKMYLGTKDRLIIPSLNIYSLLSAENTKSVCRQFFGKQGRVIALGIASYTSIEPFEIPILDDKGEVHFTGFNDQIYLHKSVARLAKGIPNPKERPTLALPWYLEFNLRYIENKLCSLENLREALDKGGILGLGTFRPYFGRYELGEFEAV